MNHTSCAALFAIATLSAIALAGPSSADPQVKTANGIVEGTLDESTGVCSFRGIPFAAPPVGDLRWREPQPVQNWKGVRRADTFGPRAMQAPIFGDMVFRSDGMSEDCLYLNVWTPAKAAKKRLPVLVYFYGGGFAGGDGSEFRYDGESMARRGIVAVTVNYRLGVFGLFAHPDLTKESPYHASGNYGLLDQSAALHWVRRNIAAFGGDPKHITIAGESAGSISVCAQMASPLSRDLIAGAIGESGGMISPTFSPVPLSKAEEGGVRFASELGATSVAQLRAMSAEYVLAAVGRGDHFRFSVNVDGYFLPKLPADIFAAGEQAHVPLLVGWNSAEGGYMGLISKDAKVPPETHAAGDRFDAEQTPENWAAVVRGLFPKNADEALKVFAASTPEEARAAATDLSGARFIAFSTWKWGDLAGKTGGKPVYRYYYTRPRPGADGAGHSAEIEYALGNLATNKVFAWTPDDYKVSETMQSFFANFVKTGNPNGAGLPNWPAANKGADTPVMHIDVDSHAEPDRHQDRYLFLDKLYSTAH